MKRNDLQLAAIIFLFLISSILSAQDPSAMVDFESSDQGVLIPRTDTTFINAAHTPAKGLLIFQNSDSTFYYFNGSFWSKISGEDADTDPVNELQVLSISSDTIYLSNGGFVKLPPDQVIDADSDPTNEFQNLTWNDGSNEMKITDGNKVSITGFLESEVDGDPTNELITGAVLDAEILKITDAGGTTSVDLGSLEGSGLWVENGTHIYNDNSGNVGIGTTTPQERFQVMGNVRLESTNPRIDFYQAGTWSGLVGFSGTTLYLQNRRNGTIKFRTNNYDRITIDETGEVGIGTVTPNALLDVRGSAVFNDDSEDANFRVESNNNSSMLFVNGGQDEVGIGITATSARLHVVQTDSDDAFQVDDKSADNSPFIIKSDGDVGIGISNPSYKLNVVYEPPTDNIGPIALFETNGATNSAAALRLENTSGNYYSFGMTSPSATNANAFSFTYNSNVGLPSDLMTLRPNGNLGIGTTTPSYPLHVIASDLDRASYFEIETNSSFASGVYGSGSGSGPVAGTYGRATGDSLNYGIVGLAFNGETNYGGRFTAVTTNSSQSSYAMHATSYGSGTNYAGYFEEGNVIIDYGDLGVGTNSPNEKMDIHGRIKISDDPTATSVDPGTIRYNVTTNDFEGYNGQWVSLTNTSGITGESRVTDIDGNIYRTVTIGTQTWMRENLRTTRFNDGTVIAEVDMPDEWDDTLAPAYCWYDNNASYDLVYGKLYNGHSVDSTSNGNKNVCPLGWHVPSEAEIMTLGNFLGGPTVAGGKMKERGQIHWTSPNTGATNYSGFTALPAGIRNFNYASEGNLAAFWTSTLDGSTNHKIFLLTESSAELDYYAQAFDIGLSLRCIKD